MIRDISFKNVEGEEIFTPPATFFKNFDPYHFFQTNTTFFTPLPFSLIF
jgi:hypothetical protein